MGCNADERKRRKEGPRGEEIAIQASGKIPCDKKETIYECCKNMVTELSEVKSELSSCKEIIRILQEEIHEISSSYQPSGNKVYEDSTKKKPYDIPIREDWTYLSSSRSRYPRLSRRNLRQLPLETSNPFAPLDNLDEDSEYPRYVTFEKRSQPLRECRQKSRQVKQCVNKPQNIKQKIVRGFFKKFPHFYIFAGNGEGGRSSNWSCLRVSYD